MEISLCLTHVAISSDGNLSRSIQFLLCQLKVYFTNSKEDGVENVKLKHLFYVSDKRVWGVVERVDVYTEGRAGYNIHTVRSKEPTRAHIQNIFYCYRPNKNWIHAIISKYSYSFSSNGSSLSACFFMLTINLAEWCFIISNIWGTDRKKTYSANNENYKNWMQLQRLIFNNWLSWSDLNQNDLTATSVHWIRIQHK